MGLHRGGAASIYGRQALSIYRYKSRSVWDYLFVAAVLTPRRPNPLLRTPHVSHASSRSRNGSIVEFLLLGTAAEAWPSCRLAECCLPPHRS